MFDKFGEFGSVEELNAAAEGLLKEGDKASLYALAKENGLDREDAEDYVDGIVDILATVTMAAAGRIAVWEQEEKKKSGDLARSMALKVIMDMIKTMCTDLEIAGAVMKKGSHPEKIYEAMKAEALKHMSASSGVGQRMAVSCGTDQELREIIRTFYLEPEKLKKKLAALYVLQGGAA